jgi:hypothetical protein
VQTIQTTACLRDLETDVKRGYRHSSVWNILPSALAVSFVGATRQMVPALTPGLWEMRAQSSKGGANTALPTSVCGGATPNQERQAKLLVPQ